MTSWWQSMVFSTLLTRMLRSKTSTMFVHRATTRSVTKSSFFSLRAIGKCYKLRMKECHLNLLVLLMDCSPSVCRPCHTHLCTTLDQSASQRTTTTSEDLHCAMYFRTSQKQNGFYYFKVGHIELVFEWSWPGHDFPIEDQIRSVIGWCVGNYWKI